MKNSNFVKITADLPFLRFPIVISRNITEEVYVEPAVLHRFNCILTIESPESLKDGTGISFPLDLCLGTLQQTLKPIRWALLLPGEQYVERIDQNHLETVNDLKEGSNRDQENIIEEPWYPKNNDLPKQEKLIWTKCTNKEKVYSAELTSDWYTDPNFDISDEELQMLNESEAPYELSIVEMKGDASLESIADYILSDFLERLSYLSVPSLKNKCNVTFSIELYDVIYRFSVGVRHEYSISPTNNVPTIGERPTRNLDIRKVKDNQEPR